MNIFLVCVLLLAFPSFSFSAACGTGTTCQWQLQSTTTGYSSNWEMCHDPQPSSLPVCNGSGGTASVYTASIRTDVNGNFAGCDLTSKNYKAFCVQEVIPCDKLPKFQMVNGSYQCMVADPNTCQYGVSQEPAFHACQHIHKGQFINNGKLMEASFLPDGTLIAETLKEVDFPGYDSNDQFHSWELTDSGWQRCTYGSSGKAVCGVPGTERPDWWPADVNKPKGTFSVVSSTDSSTVPTDGTKETTTTTTGSNGSSTTKTTTTSTNPDGSNTVTDSYTRTNPDGTTTQWTETRVIGGGSGSGVEAAVQGVKGSVDAVKGSVDGVKGAIEEGNQKLDQIAEELSEDEAPPLPGDPTYDSTIGSEHTEGPDWGSLLDMANSSPFIGVIEGSGVSLSGAECSLSGTVYNRSVSFSICDWSSIFSTMGQFVVAFAALYGLFIVVARGD